MPLRVDLNIINQKGTPAFYSDTFANRPAAGFAGRVFISTDTGAIYEDTGSAWTLIADAGAGTTGTLEQVTTNGNTTTKGLVVTSGNVAIGTATAGAPLDIHCTGTAAQFNGTGTNNAYVIFQNAGASKWRVGNLYNAGANSFEFVDAARSTNVMSLRSTGTYQEVYVNGYNTISNIASFSSSGNYAINPSLTLSIPTTTTFNTGASWSGMATSLLNTWGANNTIDQGAVMAGFIGVNRQSFNTAGVSITVTQGSNGARAICGMQVLSQTGGSINGTISHGASLLVQGVYPSGTANVTYTNYYGLLINQLDEYGTVTFTNRYGIYQGGGADKNYFAGNVGIKTSSATYPLTIFNSANGTSAAIGGTAYGIRIDNGGTFSAGRSTIYSVDNSFYGSYQPLSIEGSTIALNTNTGGNVGIGVNAPAAPLEVLGVNEGEYFRGGGGTISARSLTFSSYTISGTVGIGHRLNVQNAGGALSIAIGGSDKVTIASTGASTFANTLTVKSNAFIGDTGSSANALAQFQNSANGYQFGFSSTGTQRFVFINGGASEVANINGATGVYTPLSDINKKKDFEDSTIGLNAILGLKPTLYRMKSEDNTDKHLGFIAQEVKEYIPQAYVEIDNFIGLNDRPIIAALVKAIQELNDKLIRNNIN